MFSLSLSFSFPQTRSGSNANWSELIRVESCCCLPSQQRLFLFLSIESIEEEFRLLCYVYEALQRKRCFFDSLSSVSFLCLCWCLRLLKFICHFQLLFLSGLRAHVLFVVSVHLKETESTYQSND